MAMVDGSTYWGTEPCDICIFEWALRWSLCAYFLAAATVAAAASRWPLLASFAAHGKVRQKREARREHKQQQQQQILQKTRLVRFLRWVETKDCSKLRFMDFYATGVFVTCCCLVSLYKQQQQLPEQQKQQLSYWKLLPLTLLLVHLLRRLGEQLLLVASDDASRMHIFAYVLGCT